MAFRSPVFHHPFSKHCFSSGLIRRINFPLLSRARICCDDRSSFRVTTIQCADHRTCSHVRNCRYEDEGVSMGRARERAVCACAPKLRARERIERASIIFSGGALFLAVVRASSLSRAEAASHGPSVMACRDPAPSQTPRYRGASAHAVHAAADSRNPPGVGLCRQVPAVHLRPSLCQSRWMVASVLRFCTRVQLTGRMHALYEWV